MLIKLLPDQVEKHWDYIAYAVQKGLENVSSVELNHVLQTIYENKMQVWLSSNKSNVQGIALTTLEADPALKRKSFVLYLFYRFSWMDKNDWFDGLDTLKAYAKSIGCDRVIAYTESPEVLKLAQAMGGALKRYTIEFKAE